MSAFADIFTRDEKKNKKESYDVHLFEQDKNTGLMTTVVDEFNKNEVARHKNFKSQKVFTLNEIQDDIDETLGAALD